MLELKDLRDLTDWTIHDVKLLEGCCFGGECVSFWLWCGGFRGSALVWRVSGFGFVVKGLRFRASAVVWRV